MVKTRRNQNLIQIIIKMIRMKMSMVNRISRMNRLIMKRKKKTTAKIRLIIKASIIPLKQIPIQIKHQNCRRHPHPHLKILKNQTKLKRKILWNKKNMNLIRISKYPRWRDRLLHMIRMIRKRRVHKIRNRMTRKMKMN